MCCAILFLKYAIGQSRDENTMLKGIGRNLGLLSEAFDLGIRYGIMGFIAGGEKRQIAKIY